MEKKSLEFGKKEKVLNYACQTYQLSRPNKVGAVMALIRECQPKTFEEWEKWCFENAYSTGTKKNRITQKVLVELGNRLFEKITNIVIPEWTNAFNALTIEDCISYIRNLTLNRTFDGYIREKSVINDNLEKRFPNVRFEESDPELDHAGDIDFLGFVGDFAFGIQIKPVTAQSNFGNYSPTERMKSSFNEFSTKYRGRVFVVFSIDEEIQNKQVVDEIEEEIQRLSRL